MEHELVELERRFWLEGTTELYRRHMADDGLMVFAQPGVLDKEGTLAAVERAGPWDEVAITDMRILEASDSAAALVYAATGRRSDDEPYRALVSSLYERRGGHWKLLLHHQTALPAEA